jgi:hypothetical protein
VVLFHEPIQAPNDDLPQGVALAVACSRKDTAPELVTDAFSLLDAAQAYADHVASMSVGLGSLSYGDLGKLAGMSRQGAAKRYGETVAAVRALADVGAADLRASGVVAPW